MIKLNIHLWFYDYFTAFCAVNKRFKYDRTATYHRNKKGIVE